MELQQTHATRGRPLSAIMSRSNENESSVSLLSPIRHTRPDKLRDRPSTSTGSRLRQADSSL
jgi:hypothetical protein